MVYEALDSDFESIISGCGPSGWCLPDGEFETPAVLLMLRELANTIRPSFTPASWMIVEDGELVGLCSLVRMPGDGIITIGYGVTQLRRGRGYASGAVRAVLQWARADDRVESCKAATSIHNRASQRVLEVNGFAATGTWTDDENGEMICWSVQTSR